MNGKSKSKTLVIVPCSKRKIWDSKPDAGSVAAKDAYISPYFKLCRAFAEKYGDQWLILSAKYGVIQPDFLIENYDIHFKAKTQQGVISSETVNSQLQSFGVEDFHRIIFLGGKAYHEVLERALGRSRKLYNPLLGLPIGLRQKRLKAWLKERSKV